MASQSQGIHQLLQAEKRAKDKLEEAKKSKCPLCLAGRDLSPMGEGEGEHAPQQQADSVPTLVLTLFR